MSPRNPQIRVEYFPCKLPPAIGTPITGRVVWAATAPARWAAPPAPPPTRPARRRGTPADRGQSVPAVRPPLHRRFLCGAGPADRADIRVLTHRCDVMSRRVPDAAHGARRLGSGPGLPDRTLASPGASNCSRPGVPVGRSRYPMEWKRPGARGGTLGQLSRCIGNDGSRGSPCSGGTRDAWTRGKGQGDGRGLIGIALPLYTASWDHVQVNLNGLNGLVYRSYKLVSRQTSQTSDVRANIGGASRSPNAALQSLQEKSKRENRL